ncbi:MAG: fixI [Tardiphaga sp.]|nr:fixI [Tardiphaga sp.]
MGCCGPGADIALHLAGAGAESEDILLASRVVAAGVRQTDLSVPTIHCGACIRGIEAVLGGLPGVQSARVNLSSKRATIRWDDNIAPPRFIAALKAAGFDAHLFDIDATSDDDGLLTELIRALAVAGFAASNIMLLSVSVWSGADAETRNLFHVISAVIALPALAYCGRIFFRSAWRALSHGRTNMDVPISIGVLLAFGLSLYETAVQGPHAYFDAAISLLFFLLIGRTLDHMMRDRARQAVKGLARVSARGALVMQDDGTQTYLAIDEIESGMVIMLPAGDRVPVDAVVRAGKSDLDVSLVTGESAPMPAVTGDVLRAGTLNLTGPLTIVASAVAADSFLSEMMRMMEAAEQGRSSYRRIADRAAALYAPVVHLAAALTFIGWLVATHDVHQALTIAIAVLIITCPCALGLAVPMVQVVAAKRLFEMGIMIKDGGALERFADIDTVVFDKTGTLTRGVPRLLGASGIDRDVLSIAAALARHSRHPYSRAIVAAFAGQARSAISLDRVLEHPGTGLEGFAGSNVYRLGRPDWAVDASRAARRSHAGVSVAFSGSGLQSAEFSFEDPLRADAATAVAELRDAGFHVEIVSGDREGQVRSIADKLGVAYAAGVLPGGKAAHIGALSTAGRHVLMVGDGLNDMPALAAAHASMAPASAADVGRNAADIVFLRESLSAVPLALSVSRNAGRLIRQNLAFAVVYNAIAVPVAVMGGVTPLIAAVAMSGSSIIVVANALRLNGMSRAGSRRVRGSRRPETTDLSIAG